MKAIYHKEIHYTLTFKSGKNITDKSSYLYWYTWRYGEVPENQTIHYDNPDTVFDDLLNCLGYIKPYYGEKTLFLKRPYINDSTFDRRIYKEELVSFTKEITYHIHDKEKTSRIQDKLTFEDYTQLVFDREQELKYALLFNKENE